MCMASDVHGERDSMICYGNSLDEQLLSSNQANVIKQLRLEKIRKAVCLFVCLNSRALANRKIFSFLIFSVKVNQINFPQPSKCDLIFFLLL